MLKLFPLAELATIRSRLEKSERQQSELRLELQNLETITSEQMQGFELDRDELRSKQQQGKLKNKIKKSKKNKKNQKTINQKSQKK